MYLCICHIRYKELLGCDCYLNVHNKQQDKRWDYQITYYCWRWYWM